MTPVWFCETHEELGGIDKCWVGNQYGDEAVACEMVRMLLAPVDALVLVRDADGRFSAKTRGTIAEAIRDYAFANMTYLDIDEDYIVASILDALAEAAKENPQP